MDYTAMFRLKNSGKAASKLRIVLYGIGIIAIVVILDAAFNRPIEKVLRSAMPRQAATEVFTLVVKPRPPSILIVHYSDVMQFGKHQEVICRVAFGKADAYQNLTPSPNDIIRAINKRTDAMKVTLSGDRDLGVQMISNEEQGVAQDGITRWVADLNPHKPGKFKLNISAALLKPAGRTGRMAADLYDQSKDIRVDGAWKYFAHTTWDNLKSEVPTSVTLSILLGFIWIFLEKRGIKKPPDN